MNKIYIKVTIILLIISIATISTYAWFTSNEKVKTSSVSVSIGGDNITLLAGPTPNELSENGFEIKESNANNKTRLMPVSTVDANSFVFMENAGSTFTRFREVLEEEGFYYHGVFYIKAEGENENSINLYLDNSDNDFFTSDDDTNILNAARFAIKIGDVVRIIEVSQNENDINDRVDNTYVDGVLVKDKQIGIKNNEVFMEKAEIYSVEDSMITMNSYPDFSFDLKQNETYKIDVYFWLEGTDPDCSDAIELKNINMNIKFTGVIS